MADGGRRLQADGEEKALAWFRKAAAQGHAAAQDHLGMCYENGHGVEADAQQALAWYQRAAEQNFAGAQYHLGLLYDAGRALEADPVQAAAWM